MTATPTTRHELLERLNNEEASLESAWKQVGAQHLEQSGAMGDWTFKDLIAHLTAWREWSISRIDAARQNSEPADIWPSHIDGEDVDAINQWFYEQSKTKTPEHVLQESRASFERLRQGLQSLSDGDLFTPDRFAWMKGKPLGPRIVSSSVDHFYEEHEADLRTWIDQL